MAHPHPDEPAGAPRRSRLVDRFYRNVTAVSGPLLFARRAGDIPYGAAVEIRGGSRPLLGQVLDLSEEAVVIEVLGSTQGLGTAGTELVYSDQVFRLPVSRWMLGRVLDGKGTPIDGLPPYPAAVAREITGAPLNPSARQVPDRYVETGVSAIDVMNTLVQGQKLPIFSCAGLPSNELAALIVRSASAPAEAGADRELLVVFAGMGIPHRDVAFFLQEFQREGALERTVVFLNRADEPVIERLMAPRCALTAAEYLAFDRGHDVLVVLTDMTHYCEALREIGSAREEIPGRRGYPGYMYTDLASLYERAGRIRDRPGSVTQIPIVTMPDDDITHPIPDLTGYVTEGQIVLDRDLHRQGVVPPVAPLASLSRLMGKVAAKRTREDHKAVSDQLYALYARAMEIRRVAAVVGEENLSDEERSVLAFARRFEGRFLNQQGRPRRLNESLALAWELLGPLETRLLTRIPHRLLEAYLPEGAR
ncbi:MAG: V-type ATP synthase subunit B [Deferrisomatales bacterium]